jgi:hypothetical protein
VKAVLGIRGFAVGLLTLLVLAAVSPGTGAGSASAASAPLQVLLTFDGSGTFTAGNQLQSDSPDHATVALKWSTTYTGTLSPDGSLTLKAAGASATGEGGQTTAPPPGTFHYTDSGQFTADCSNLPLPLAPGAPSPVATVSGGTLNVQSVTSVDQNNQTGQVNCQGTDMFGNPFDESQQAANLAGTFGPSLPDVLAARVSVSADELKSGTVTKAVSDADAPAQLPASCSAQFGEPSPGDCQMSLHWNGTITITTPCGEVSFSEGDAPAVGTIINKGQTISTGAKSRVELITADGSFYRLGPNSKMVCGGEPPFKDERPPVSDEFKLLLGNIWAATSNALGGDHQFEQQTDRAAGGVRGSEFTASVRRGGKVLYHVIEGTGFFRIKGEKEFDFPAGEGLIYSDSHYAVTTTWPAADQALVPKAQLGPKLTALKLVGHRAGKATTLHFKLSQNAKVTIQIVRGKKRVLRKKRSERHGARSIKLGSLPKGRYTLTLFATVNKRSVAEQKSFRLS